jgi:hypothetical protein
MTLRSRRRVGAVPRHWRLLLDAAQMARDVSLDVLGGMTWTGAALPRGDYWRCHGRSRRVARRGIRDIERFLAVEHLVP